MISLPYKYYIPYLIKISPLNFGEVEMLKYL